MSEGRKKKEEEEMKERRKEREEDEKEKRERERENLATAGLMEGAGRRWEERESGRIRR
jgi:hypothetical protein